MSIERLWAMPNHETFKIPCIKQLIAQELGEFYTDVFPHPYDKDGLEMLKGKKSNSIENLAFDPVYSLRQLKEMYNNKGNSLTHHETKYYWKDLRDQIARVLKVGGRTISFGWNSIGIGKKRGFEITKILLVCHGGHHNDTICTVERKIY